MNLSYYLSKNSILKIYIFLTLLIIVPNICTGNKIDSIYQTITSLSEKKQLIQLHFVFGNEFEIIESDINYQKLIELLYANNKLDAKTIEAISYYENMSEAILEKDLKKRINILKRIYQNNYHDTYFGPVVLHQIGMNYFVDKNFELALKYLLQSQNLFEIIGYDHYPESAVYLHDLALVYYTFHDYKQAINLMLLATSSLPYSSNLSIQKYNTIAESYYKLNDTISANQYNKLAQIEALKYDDLYWVYKLKSNALIKFNEYKDDVKINAYKEIIKTLDLIEDSLQNNADKYYDFYILNLKIKLSLLNEYLKNDIINDAKDLYAKISSTKNNPNKRQLFLKDENQQNVRLIYYQTLKDYFKKINDYHKAYLYADSFSILNETINKNYNQNILQLSSAKLAFEQNQLAVNELKTSRKNNILIIIILIFILALVIVIYYYYRSTTEKDKLKLQNEAKDLALQVVYANNDLKESKIIIENYLENLNQKNQLINQITDDLEKLKTQLSQKESTELDHKINLIKDSRIITENDWITFQKHYETINKNLYKNLKLLQPKLTEAELRYLLLYSLDLNNKMIADILGISPDSLRVTWNRIKKKYTIFNIDNPSQLLAYAKSIKPNTI